MGYGTCACGAGAGGAGGGSGTAGATGSAGSTAIAGTSGGAEQGGAGGFGGHGGAGNAGTTGTGGRLADGGQTDGSVPNGGGDSGISRLVSVQILDAIIAPGKADGTVWDGVGNVDPAVLQAVATALVGVNPVAGVLAALGNPALDAIDKPDAFGTCQLTVLGVTYAPDDLATDAGAIMNNYTPIWPSVRSYKNIPVDTDVRMNVSLFDSDLVYNDPIGVATINSADLLAALASQKKYEVRVDDQTAGQLLFIGISVTLQTGPL
jgi:hypothetical protein